MKRITQYLLREVIGAFAAVTLVLMMIFSGVRFIRYLGDAAHGRLPAELVFQLMMIVSVGSLGQVLPFAIFIATLIAFGRLYKDNEMTILSACGVGQLDILKAMVAPITFSCAVAALFSLYLNPLMVEKSFQIRETSANQSQIAGVRAGAFTQYQGGKYTFYVESLSGDQQHLSNIFLQTDGEDGDDIFIAPLGNKVVDSRGNEFLELHNGYRYHENQKNHEYDVYQYEKATIRLPDPDAPAVSRTSRALSTQQLIESDKLEDRAELHWRIAAPVSVMMLAILGILFSHTTPRQGRYAKLFAAILLYLVYSNLLAVGQSWLERGVIPAYLGLWWVHGLTLAMIIGLVIKRNGREWTWAVVTGRARAMAVVK